MIEEKNIINEIKNHERNIKNQTSMKETYLKHIVKYLNEIKIDNENIEYNLKQLEKLLIDVEYLNANIDEEIININVVQLLYNYNFNLPVKPSIEQFKDIKKLNIYKLHYKLQLYKLLLIKDTESDEYKDSLKLVKKYKLMS